MKFVANTAEELAEPEHLFHMRHRTKNTDTRPPVVPVAKHPEKTAGDIFDKTHVDPQRTAFFFFEKSLKRLPDERQFRSIPDFHRSDIQDSEFAV